MEIRHQPVRIRLVPADQAVALGLGASGRLGEARHLEGHVVEPGAAGREKPMEKAVALRRLDHLDAAAALEAPRGPAEAAAGPARVRKPAEPADQNRRWRRPSVPSRWRCGRTSSAALLIERVVYAMPRRL